MRFFTIAVRCFILSLVSSASFSQSTDFKTPYTDSSYHFVGLSFYGSSIKQTPFWMHANQYGIVPKESPSTVFHTAIEHFLNIDRKQRRYSVLRAGGGIEAVVHMPDKKMLLPQLYGSLRFKNWELFIGRKKQVIGLADSTVGMGSYVWSGNTMPVPKIQLGTRRFVPLPFTNSWISFHAFYSDGFFEKNRYSTSGLNLHQKALYLKLGRDDSRLRLYGGFNHQVQWGGKSPYHTIDDQMPNGMKNYWNVVTGKAHVKSDRITHFDSTNRIGNHLGTVDLAVELEMINHNLLIYRQNLYEDGSLYYLDNISDGLNGIRFRRKALYSEIFSIRDIVIEFLYTKNQAGPIANVDSYKRGKDNYFNNAQVRDGWSYMGRTIGTPFISPTSDIKPEWPPLADFFTNNNRVAVWHVGLAGECLRTASWSAKLSYSSNAGTYDVPFPVAARQFSGLIDFNIPVHLLGKMILKCSVAADYGKLYSKSYGFSLGLRKNDLLNFR
jgi:hypothetical protein